MPQGLLRHIAFSQVRVVLVGSPGFTKDDFFAFMCEEAQRTDNRVS
jgi:protein pelota